MRAYNYPTRALTRHRFFKVIQDTVNLTDMLSRPLDFMAYSLSLAELALGYTSPNPAVGAVLVHDGVVVGLGHTQQPGLAHAEVMAINQAGEMAKGATMYVTLEPCINCSKLIISAGIKEVYYLESYREHDGINLLEKNGIKVIQLI